MFVFIRALTYAALFMGLVLFFIPARLLSSAGVLRPETIGPSQVAGAILASFGLAIALWCVLTFARDGKGTPAPFDPPRLLVSRGPYRYVRNPMYIGAGLVLAGAALYFRSLLLAEYMALFFAIVHLFVVLYEEPTLRRTFAGEYDAYRSRVRRWLPIPSRSTVEPPPVFGQRVSGQAYIRRPSIYAIIEDRGSRLAVVRTPKGSFLPGGGVEPGETPNQALAREVREECGFAIRVGERIGRATQLVSSPDESKAYEKVSEFVEASREGPVADSGTESDHRLLWLAPEEAAQTLTHESHRWAVLQWQKPR